MPERKTLKISPKVYQDLEEKKRENETWNSFFERLLAAAEHIDLPQFEYEVTSNSKLITLTVYPSDNSELRIGDSGGKHQSIPTLYTSETMITNEDFKPALEDIEGIQHGGLTHTGGIQVKIPRDADIDMRHLVDEVFNTIIEVIQEKEDPVSLVKQAVDNYAVPRKEST